MDRLFAARWAGGWAGTRVLFALSGLLWLATRAPWLADAYAAPDMVFSTGPFYLNDHWIINLRIAWGVWILAAIGLLGVIRGGWAMRPGLVAWMAGNGVLLAAEALDLKAYDRLSYWIALGVLLSPANERELTQKWRSPVARWFLLVAFAGLYGSTGWLKILEEPRWWTGEVLAHHLVELPYSRGAFPAWVSAHAWLTAPMSWHTLLFEAGFPFLCWWRRTNPWILLLGVGMHIGILALMNVGPFSFIALSAYPALLDPDVARRLWGRVRR